MSKKSRKKNEPSKKEELTPAQAETLQYLLSGAQPSTHFSIGYNQMNYIREGEVFERRLYLYGPIYEASSSPEAGYGFSATSIAEIIMEYNRADKGLPVEERKPVMLYINSPGGSLTDGFALASIIEASKTPIYTVNIGECSSMAFLIGITGHKRYSIKNAVFLMHDGAMYAAGSSNKVYDQVRFYEDYDNKVVRKHVLKHTKITKKKYEQLLRKEAYMLPEEALKLGVIDKIVNDLDKIL